MDQTKIEEMNYALKQMGDPEAGRETFEEHRWRSKVLPKMLEGDVVGMKEEAAPFAQMQMTRLALEGKTEQTRLSASMFVLGQAGHGVVQKHEHTMEFNKMPSEQLMSVISSKIERLQKLNPNFDFTKLLESHHKNADPESQNVVHIEAEEVVDGK